MTQHIDFVELHAVRQLKLGFGSGENLQEVVFWGCGSYAYIQSADYAGIIGLLICSFFVSYDAFPCHLMPRQ